MVFRFFLGNLIREAAQDKLQEATADAADAALRHLELKCDLLVAMALPIEAGGLVDLLSDTSSMKGQQFTEHIGMLARGAPDDAASVAQTLATTAIVELIAHRKPQWVISAGFAGGLHDDMERGHFLMADTVVQSTSQEELSIGLTMDPDALIASPGVHVGRLLTVDHIVRHAGQRRELGSKHKALACDMETYAVAAACQKTNTRFLSVRIVSDAVDQRRFPNCLLKRQLPRNSALPRPPCGTDRPRQKTCGSSRKKRCKPPIIWRSFW